MSKLSIARVRELKIIQTLLPLLKFYPWAIPTIVILGVSASLSEGLGITLLIPFTQSMDKQTNLSIGNSLFITALDRVFVGISPDTKNLVIAGCILTTIFFKATLSYLYTVLCFWLEAHVVERLRQRVFSQLMSLSMSFWNANKSGEMVGIIIQETGDAARALAHFIWMIVDTSMIVIFTIFLLLISVKLTLLVAVAFFSIAILARLLTRQANQLGTEKMQANLNVSALAMAGVTGIKTIQSFGRENYEFDRFRQAAQQARKILVKINILSSTIAPLSEGVTIGFLILMMFIAMQSQLSLPVLLAFIFMLYRLQPQIAKFDNNRIQALGYLGAVDRVMSLLDPTDKPYIHSGTRPFTGLQHGIVFKSVCFYYQRERHPALSEIELSIPQGKTTALVGYSGAGKSTLIDLLFRFYEPTAGEIYIDSYRLQDLDLAQWRSRIAIVSQDVHIFNTSIRENITYGNFEATDAAVVAAAKQAHAHDFICELDRGYDTVVGDRGTKLSGGQKQRISIARAILANPEIIILDEATNALDSVSERIVQATFDTLSRSRTTIIIAHRLSTIEHADNIVVMERGTIVEQGNLGELLELDGLFSKLYKVQYNGSIDPRSTAP
jgi:ATP-binding cassette, subfamily B, bacterial MsbA